MNDQQPDNKNLMHIRLLFFKSPVLLLLILALASLFGLKPAPGFWFGWCIGFVINLIFRGRSLKFITGFSVDQNEVHLQLLNFWNQHQTLSLNLAQIERTKLRRKNWWRLVDRIWIELPDSVKSFYIIESRTAENLFRMLSPDRKQIHGAYNLPTGLP